MRVPFNWLKEFVPIDAAAADVSDSLTMRGLEVEGLEVLKPLFSDVYVGAIVEVRPHPSADRLSVCLVHAGGEVVTVVCGAPNVEAGQKAALAVPGARLPDGSVVERRSFRGVESAGVLMSERELALSDEGAGIFVLPASLKEGTPLADTLEIADSVLDVNVPPNRGDCQSILGIAREVASIYGLPVTLPPFGLEEKGGIEGLIGLSVLDNDACPRYVLRMVRGISIVKSPFVMRTRIAKAGMRAINSIVDVTNYIMFELGQPLHAFDYARIADSRIEVKVAKAKTVFRTLDGQDRKIEPGDTLICDGSGPVAIAGVMGGENSEIGSDTKDVALESAFFNPLMIRRTARRLDLRSEASLRFEKGIDIEGVDYAAKKAVWLMAETSGGQVLSGSVEAYERRPVRTIDLGLRRACDIIGTDIPPERITGGLASLGLRSVGEREGRVTFSIPSFRHDLVEYFDLIEEAARVFGYNEIPATAPVSPLIPVKPAKGQAVVDGAKTFLTSCGFFEAINYGFFGTKDIEAFSIAGTDERASCVPLMNPISRELGVMRTFLAAGLLRNIAYNTNRGAKNARLFEVGKVFMHSDASVLPREAVHLALAATGKEREYFWREAPGRVDFFDLKGVIEGLFERFCLPLAVAETKEPFLKAGQGADLLLSGEKVGWMGVLDDGVRAAFEVDEEVLCAEVDLGAVMEKGTGERTYRPIPRFPAVTRDFSFYVDDSIPVGELLRSISEVSPLIVSVGVFDIFKKEVRSISIRVVFQSFDETLTDEAVNGLQKIIIDRLTGTEGIRLRT